MQKARYWKPLKRGSALTNRALASRRATLWKPRKNGSATMVSMTSNKTSLEAAAVDAGTTKRAEAGRIVIVGCVLRCGAWCQAEAQQRKFGVVSW